MARKVFFSFHYDDVSGFKVNNVRNSWITHDPKKRDTFSDSSIWEEARSKGPKAIKELIDNVGLKGSSVTAVLIGQGTYSRRWVRYEIVKSFVRGNGIVGLHLNRLKGKEQKISAKGVNPFSQIRIHIDKEGKKISFQELKNSQWIDYKDFPSVSNKKSNTRFFKSNFFGNNRYYGRYIKLTEFFPTFCWVKEDGYNNFPKWIEQSFTASHKNIDNSNSWSLFN